MEQASEVVVVAVIGLRSKESWSDDSLVSTRDAVPTTDNVISGAVQTKIYAIRFRSSSLYIPVARFLSLSLSLQMAISTQKLSAAALFSMTSQ